MDSIYPNWPRGLSRELASRYVGVSMSLFDILVKDGRMPQAMKINARRVWDRLLLDQYFEAIDGKFAAKQDSRWEFSNESPGSAAPPSQAAGKDVDYDLPYVISEIDFGEIQKWHPQEWVDYVRSRELGVLEKRALGYLHSRKGEIVSSSEIKGCGPSTLHKLVARGYANPIPDKGDASRMPDHSITPEGEAAWLACNVKS